MICTKCSTKLFERDVSVEIADPDCGPAVFVTIECPNCARIYCGDIELQALRESDALATHRVAIEGLFSAVRNGRVTFGAFASRLGQLGYTDDALTGEEGPHGQEQTNRD